MKGEGKTPTMYIQEGTDRTVGISAIAWPLVLTRCRRMEIEEKRKLLSGNDYEYYMLIISSS